MRIKRYLMIMRNSIMGGLAYRAHFFFMMLGTLIYIVVAYFLWKAIYANGGTINGLSFSSAYLYVAVSMSFYGLLQTWTEWQMHWTIKNGDLIRFLCKPLDYPTQLLFDMLGGAVTNFAGIGLPALVIAYILSGAALPGLASVLLCFGALSMGFLINFFIDFCVGLTVFVTHSIWGISTAKEVTVLFLSGAVVPLAFFPANVRSVLEWLPFQAIYNTPVRLLIDPTLGMNDVLFFFARQVAWLLFFFLLARLLFQSALRKVVINGG